MSSNNECITNLCVVAYGKATARHTYMHKSQPTGKTRLTDRDGDCSITMVTQMGPRERLASTVAGGK